MARAAMTVATIACAATSSLWFDRWSSVADGVAFLAPVWIGIGLAATASAGWLSRHWRWPGAAAIFLIGSVMFVLLSLRPHATPAPTADAGGTIRIISLNAWKDNPTPDVAANWILKEAPDVVVLLEGAENSAEIVRRLASRYPFRTSCRGDAYCSTLILSRRPPVERRGLAHGDADNRRALSAALVAFGAPGPPFTLIAVHLGHEWPFGDQARDINALLGTRVPRNDLIIAGDFNAPPWTAALGKIERGFDIRRITGGDATWPAPPSGLPLPAILPIDHILIGSNWAVRDLRRGPAVGSDHYPLLVTLTPIDKAGQTGADTRR